MLPTRHTRYENMLCTDFTTNRGFCQGKTFVSGKNFLRPENYHVIIKQKQKHLNTYQAQAVHRLILSFMNQKDGCISVKSGIMLLNSNITIEAGGRRRTDVTDHTVACFLYSPAG